MVNQSFSQLSKEEKQGKLHAALRCMTGDTLTKAELEAISCMVRLECQYFIRVHHTSEAFFSDLTHPVQCQTRFIIGSRPVSQQNLKDMLRCAAKTGDPVTAVVDHIDGKNGIYILIPEQQNEKGTTS